MRPILAVAFASMLMMGVDMAEPPRRDPEPREPEPLPTPPPPARREEPKPVPYQPKPKPFEPFDSFTLVNKSREEARRVRQMKRARERSRT